MVAVGVKSFITETFAEKDAEFILSIPLSDTAQDSIWRAWTSSASYLVKSGYNRLLRNQAEPNPYPVIDYEVIRCRKIPQKIQNLIWRVLTEVLSSKADLKRRHSDVDIQCLPCQQEDETTFHVVVSYSKVRRI